MNLSPKTDRLNEKQQKQVLLSKVYTMQMKEKAEREKEYENMQKEQAELWKKEVIYLIAKCVLSMAQLFRGRNTRRSKL